MTYKRKIKNRKNQSLIKRILMSRYISVVLGIVLVLLTIFIWKTTEYDSLLKLSQNVESTSNIHVNKIETKLVYIELALNEIVDTSPPYTFQKEKDWDVQADFYINNLKGVSHIVWIDKDLIIRRVMPVDNKTYTIGKEINTNQVASDNTSLVFPIYSEDIIAGFILGNINIPELILSVAFDTENHYMIQVLDNSEVIGSSDNWEQIEKNISVKKDISFNNKTFSLVIEPTKEQVDINTSNSYKILIYGLVLSFAVAGLALFLQIFRERSEVLVTTQKGLVDKKSELEEKNILLESQLRDQQKLQSIGLLASGIAHEINNPITGIMNYSQIILDSSDEKSENSGYAKEIINETKRVSNLVNNLLQFSRQRKNSYSNARPEDIISRTVSLMNTIFKKDHISLQEEVDQNLPDIQCNSQQIQQVLMNLLTNARDALNEKYSGYDENKIILLYCTTIEKENRQLLRITVEDHGNGIPEDVQKKMFTQFYTTKEIDKGTGLGLYISLEIIKEHQAYLSFETEEGNFTKFYLDLAIDNT